MDPLAPRVLRRFLAFKYEPKESKQSKVDRLMRLIRERTGIGRAAAEDIADAVIRNRELDRLAHQKQWPMRDGMIEGPTGTMSVAEVQSHLPLKRASAYAYHSLKSSVLAQVKAHGLKPGSAPSFDDAYSEYDDGQHLFFSDSADYVRGAFGDALLRFPWPSDAKQNKNKYGRSIGHQFVTKQKVAPTHLEIEDNGRWVPLQDWSGRLS